MLASASVANAATFNFSFSNVEGAVGGTVEGIIELPDGDGTFAATAVTVTSAPPSLGYSFPLDVLTEQIFENTFTVLGGMIDAGVSRFESSFIDANPILPLFGLNTSFLGGSYLTTSTNNSEFVNNTGVFDSLNSTVTYSSASATTPEPTSMITLIGLGLLGVGSKLKKKS